MLVWVLGCCAACAGVSVWLFVCAVRNAYAHVWLDRLWCVSWIEYQYCCIGARQECYGQSSQKHEYHFVRGIWIFQLQVAWKTTICNKLDTNTFWLQPVEFLQMDICLWYDDYAYFFLRQYNVFALIWKQWHAVIVNYDVIENKIKRTRFLNER